jgi:isoamylase
MGVFLNGEAITEPDQRGQKVRDDSFMLLLNAHSDDIVFTVPDEGFGERWAVALDTATPKLDDRPEINACDELDVLGRAMLLLRRIC